MSRGLDGSAVIGTDKPCVEECRGNRFMGMQGKERQWEDVGKGGNEDKECREEFGGMEH